MNVTSSASSDEEWDIEIDFFDNNYYGIPRRYWVHSELWQNYGPGEYFKTVCVKFGRFSQKCYKYFQMAMNKLHYFLYILYTIIAVYFGLVCIESDQEQFVITHR